MERSAASTPRDCGKSPMVNIGGQEIGRRRLIAWIAGFFAAGLWAALTIAETHPAWRLWVFLPAAVSAVSALEVWNRFCVYYGVASIENVNGDPRPHRKRHANAGNRRRDVRHSAFLAGIGVLIAAAVTALAVALP